MGSGLPTTDVSDTKLTYDGLFLALQELLEMLHTLSGNLKFVCQQFLYPTRLRDSVTKCLLRCFRDYEFKLVSSRRPSHLSLFHVYEGDFLFIPSPTGYTSDPFPKPKSTKSYAHRFTDIKRTRNGLFLVPS